MTARWTIGAAEISALISGGELQKLTGEAANDELFRLSSAKTLVKAGVAA